MSDWFLLGIVGVVLCVLAYFFLNWIDKTYYRYTDLYHKITISRMEREIEALANNEGE
jgi:hypothetical protein